jgi:hypothetical protein
MDRLAIDATYVDYRRVKGRKVHQIIFEVPSEKWPEAYRVLGEPTIETAEWFAIAKMQGIKPQESKGGRLAQKAGILCAEVGFRRFLAERNGNHHALSEDETKNAIYLLCGVSSRAHLDHDDQAGRTFRELEIEYRNWLNGVAA